MRKLRIILGVCVAKEWKTGGADEGESEEGDGDHGTNFGDRGRADTVENEKRVV